MTEVCVILIFEIVYLKLNFIDKIVVNCAVLLLQTGQF